MARTDREFRLEDGPWVEMQDTLSPTARKEGSYLYAQNVYPQDPELGGQMAGRPGSRPMGAPPAEGVVIGGLGNSANGITQFSSPTHGELSVCASAGSLYVYDWTTEAWTMGVSQADIVAAGANLGAGSAAIISLTNAFDKLVVSDGTYNPFLWDGTIGGGVTPLPNAQPLYGPPTLYQGRLFGISGFDLRKMIWSEPDDPTTGYEAGGYNNAWTLRQTDPHTLTRLVGTNQGIVIFREHSITMALGDVGENFASASTSESIDSTVGTKTPYAVCEVGANIAFLDANLRPHIVLPGAVGARPCWQGFREELWNGPARAIDNRCSAVYWSALNLVLFAVPDGFNKRNLLLVLNVVANDIPRPAGVWLGWAIGSDQTHVIAILRRPVIYSDSSMQVLVRGMWPSGRVYQFGHPDDDPFLTDDAVVNAGLVPIEHVFRTQPLGHSTKRDKIFDRVDLTWRADDDANIEVQTISPLGESDPQTVSLTPVDDYATESHGAIGIDVQARWTQVRIRHARPGEQFGLVAVTVTGYATDDDPPIP
jgi:hypothetical protein